MPTSTREPRMDWRNERGIALALTLFALVIMGALLSAAVVVGRHDRAASDNTVLVAAAQSAAEAGLDNLYATWDPMIHSVLPVWDGTPGTEWSGGVRQVGGNPTLVWVDSLRRLNSQIFLARSIGQKRSPSGQVLAQLTLAQIFRVAKPTVGVNAAITVQDPVTFNGNAFLVTGINQNPANWGPGECAAVDPGSSDDVVGVRSSTTTGVAPADYDNVFGFPARDAANDPTITSATFQNYLDYTYTTLASQPGVKVLPLTTPYNGVAPVVDNTTSPPSCDRTAPLNLGEPRRNPPTAGAVPQCYGYYPVAHGTGSSTKFASGTRGQGTLLIDGDLELAGGFEWAGLIIIRGKMKINGNGNKITGAILAEGVNLLTSGTVSGNVDVLYSKCAIEKAVGGASLARPLSQRSWAQAY
jgi:hypothetical protein